MIVSIIVARAKNSVIGRNNDLPWKLSDDLKNFKKVTMGHHIIMGRKTFDSMGKPLPGRITIIITRDRTYHVDDCLIAHSVEEAVQLARLNNETEAFIIGGAEIIRQSIGLADKIYLTEVHANVEGDVYLPEIKMDQWRLINKADYGKSEKNQYDFSILELEKKFLP